MLKVGMHYLSKIGLFGLMVLLVAACSRQEPTATPAQEEPAEAVQVEEEATAVPEAAEAAESDDTAEAAADQPEISQPIYRWGEVADRLWVLVGYGDELNPTVVEEGIVITAVFSSVDGQVSGSGGCNNYFTAYESSDDGDISISGPIGSTMMACEGSMEAEGAYFAALETVTNWSLNEEGRLELTYDSGSGFEEKLVL